MASREYYNLLKNIQSAIDAHDAHSYEKEIDLALKNFMITEDEANKLYDEIEDVAQHYEDLYITTPIKSKDAKEINFKELLETIESLNYPKDDLKAFEEQINELVKENKISEEEEEKLRNALYDAEEWFEDLYTTTPRSLDSKIGDIIKKESEGYIIYSEKGKRLSKAFKTRKEAEERLKEIEMFKHMKKDSSEYEIVPVREHFEIHKNGEFVASADNESEAKKEIEEMKKEEQKVKPIRWEIEFVNGDDVLRDVVVAKTKEDAIKVIKKRWGNKISAFPNISKLEDSKKEIKDMFEEVKEWLKQYLVKKDDPNNKLGKAHIRPLKNEEKLPEGVYHKAATDRSGIVHYKGAEYYWYLDNEDELHVQRYLHDSAGDRFICESYYDVKMNGLEDKFESNDLGKVKDWILDKSQDGFITRVIDDQTGEVWAFGYIDDPFELDKIKPYEPKEEEFDEEIITKPEYIAFVVQWYDPKGYKHTIEYDSEEDANEYIKAHQDEEHINMKLVEENRFMNDSKKFNKEEIEKKLRKILTDYLLKQGYDKEDIDEWLVIRFRDFTNDYGDKGIEIEIANEFVDYYDLPNEVTEAMDKVIAPSYFEPYSATIWQGYVFDKHLEDTAGKYIYQFPAEMTEKDLNKMKEYGLEVMGKVGEIGFQPGDYVVKGTLENLEKYCDEYLDYKMHPDYLYKEQEFDTEVLVNDEGSDSTKIMDLYSRCKEIAKRAIISEGYESFEEADLEVLHEKDGEQDLIILNANPEYSGSEFEEDLVNEIEEEIEKEYPHSEFKWYENSAGGYWKLKE